MTVAALKPSEWQSPIPGTQVMADGSLLVSAAVIERFGNGNADQGRKDLRLFLANERDAPRYAGPTPRPENVRIAGPADEPACCALLHLDIMENAADLIAPFDPERALELVQTGTRQRGGFVGVIDGADKKPIGLIILTPCQWWWSKGWFFQEIVLFVHPDHRASKHADSLMQFGKWASDHMSAVMGYRWWFLNSVLTSKREHAKIAWYRRKFWQVGGVFMYPPPPQRGG